MITVNADSFIVGITGFFVLGFLAGYLFGCINTEEKYKDEKD